MRYIKKGTENGMLAAERSVAAKKRHTSIKMSWGSFFQDFSGVPFRQTASTTDPACMQVLKTGRFYVRGKYF